jgi:hypothetical protein
MTTESQPIRRLASGAIDTGYYCERGRAERASAARKMFRRAPSVKVAALAALMLLAIAVIVDVTHIAGASALVH